MSHAAARKDDDDASMEVIEGVTNAGGTRDEVQGTF